MFPAQQYSLVISGNSHLQTLNLASLKRIENGGVRITSNPQLCLVDTISIEDYLTGSGSHRVGGYAQDCSGITYSIVVVCLSEMAKILILKFLTQPQLKSW